MTQQDQIKYIGLDKFNVIDKLNKLIITDWQLTGSISLLAYGISERAISDIDIVVPTLDGLKFHFDRKGFDYTEWFDYSDEMENPKDTAQEKGKVTNRISFEVDGIKVCAFYGKDQDCKVFDFLVGRKFKVSHPKYSIEAKKKYVVDLLEMDNLNFFQQQKLIKHSKDIAAYYKWLTDSPLSLLNF